ncbi:MAG: threonine synthase [Gaiellales bacterium]
MAAAVNRQTIGVVERYRERLALEPGARVVTMGEGSTPLVHAPRISERLGVEVWLKLESMNPTGSFKDRGMTVAVSKAVADGASAVICASTGNTAASAAAYAARAGLVAVILQPAGAVALGKLAQARAVGARLLEVRGSFDQALRAAMELGRRGTHVLVNSVNPWRLEGQKTAPFEIAEELGAVPDVLALPYGGGGNTTAYARGFEEWGGAMPRILAGESAHRAQTVASAIRIAEPVHQHEVEVAVARHGVEIVTLGDDAILAAWKELATTEGVFCEPSSAASIAALAASAPRPGSLAVCVITGHGLKDPATVERSTPPPLTVDPDPDAIAEASA